VRAGSLPRLARTLRHLRPQQALAQVRHRLAGGVRPRRFTGPAPEPAFRAPAVPFLPGPAHARYQPLPDGHRLRLLEREVTFTGRVDWDHAEAGPLWSYHLHQFDYLRQPDVPPERRTALVQDWIERHPRGRGWDPHPLGLRVAAWLQRLLTPGALDLGPGARERVLRSLADQLDTLAAHPEVHLQANHLLSNLLAQVLGGLCLRGAGADAWLSGEAALRVQLAEQVLADGAHVERSPMYHAHLLQQLLDCINAAASGSRAPERLDPALRDAASRMLGALRVWTHPDGEIALFADSAFGMAPPPDALLAYARALGVEAAGPPTPGLLHAAGTARLEAGPFVLLASLAGPMPAHQPGHAHCDALAFELSLGSQRVVTDTGVCEYVPGPLRDASRATRSHATLEVGGHDQAEMWAAHRVGGRPDVRCVAFEDGRRAEGTCAGWATRDSVHRRIFELDADGLTLRDRLEGRPRAVRSVLPLAPEVEVRLEGAQARLALPEGGALRVVLPAALAWRVEALPYFPAFGRVQERSALVGEAPGPDEAVTRIELERDPSRR